MAIFSIDNCKGVPQIMELPWQVAKAMYHSSCEAYDRMGWEEGDGDESEGYLKSRYRKDGQMVMISYTELD